MSSQNKKKLKKKKVNKRTPFNKQIATEKSPKINQRTPTFIPESRVSKAFVTKFTLERVSFPRELMTHVFSS